jgi:PIN domain nuclease of toxin-antitoxin system
MKANSFRMKTILIDSHILLWWLKEPERLSSSHYTFIENPANKILISIASMWELYIKASLQKLALPENFYSEIDKNQFSILEINQDHLSGILALPQYHRDPFDRLIISQAITEKIPVITHNQAFSDYPVELL